MGHIMKICLKDHVSFLRKKKHTLGMLRLGPAHYSVKFKFVKIQGKPNRPVFTYISGWVCRFELSFFVLTRCVLACSFAYRKPYVFKTLNFTL